MRVLVLTASVALAVGVAAGALAMALLRPSKTAPRFVVPDVQRLSTAGAFHVLQGGVGPVAVMYRPSSSARAGQVLLQNPPPGTVVSRGARVTLLVASR